VSDRNQSEASDKGLIAELKFELECISRKIPISKPIHPKSVYDYIIDVSGKLLKVQVKYTSCKNPSGNFRLTCFKGNSSRVAKRHNYDKNDIDYIIGLTSNGDWYLIPIEKGVTTCITLCKKYEEFKNNWSFQ
jgi:hypothetical protein